MEEKKFWKLLSELFNRDLSTRKAVVKWEMKKPVQIKNVL